MRPSECWLILDIWEGVLSPQWRPSGAPRYQRVKATTKSELEDLDQLISQRVANDDLNFPGSTLRQYSRIQEGDCTTNGFGYTSRVALLFLKDKTKPRESVGLTQIEDKAGRSWWSVTIGIKDDDD